MSLNEKIQRMIRPEELKKNKPLKWSTGTGTEVWDMFCAAITGDLETIQRLVNRDPSLVRSHYAYRTPLYFAVRENQIEIARFLLEHGADPLSLGVNDSLLHITRDRGYGEMEKLLEAALASRQGASPKGNAVAAAIRERNLEKVRSLLDAWPELLHAGDERSNQPIHWAVMTRQIDLIDELLARGADINARRCDGARPIHLSNGDYHYRGWRDVPKDVAATPGEVLAHLIARGAYVDIWTAARMGDLNRVRDLLDQDPSLANRNSDYNSYYLGCGSPLKNAAAKNVEKAAILIDHGADLHARDEDICSTPLGWAAKFGKTRMVEFLLRHGAKPNLADDPPWATPLAWATRRGHDDIVALLKQHGAEQVGQQNRTHMPPIATSGNERAFGCDPQSQREESWRTGWTIP